MRWALTIQKCASLPPAATCFFDAAPCLGGLGPTAADAPEHRGPPSTRYASLRSDKGTLAPRECPLATPPVSLPFRGLLLLGCNLIELHGPFISRSYIGPRTFRSSVKLQKCCRPVRVEVAHSTATIVSTPEEHAVGRGQRDCSRNHGASVITAGSGAALSFNTATAKRGWVCVAQAPRKDVPTTSPARSSERRPACTAPRPPKARCLTRASASSMRC